MESQSVTLYISAVATEKVAPLVAPLVNSTAVPNTVFKPNKTISVRNFASKFSPRSPPKKEVACVSVMLGNAHKVNKRAESEPHLLIHSFLFFKLSLSLRFGFDFEFGLGLT